MHEIRRLGKQDVPLAKKLWEQAFPEDAGEFTEWYFANRFHPEDCYGFFLENELMSMAQVGKDMLWINGKTLPANLLRGVATAKEQEGKGYASKLLGYILRELAEQGEAISILKTFIHPFYKRLGYETYSYRQIEKLQDSKKECRYQVYSSTEQISEQLILQLLNCYHDYLKGKSGYLYRDASYFRKMLEEALDFCKGYLITIESPAVTAYCIAYPEEEMLYAEEIVGSKAEWECFAHAAWKMGLGFSCLHLEAQEGEPDAMARVLSVKALLESTAIQGKAKIQITDDLLKENQAVWDVDAQNGKVMIQKSAAQAADICLGSGEVAVLCLGGSLPNRELPKCMQTLWNKAELGIFEQY